MGKIIENSILSYYRGGYIGLMPHPTLIFILFILGGVEGDIEEEETCPRTLPLTLIEITKGPKNGGTGREVEAVREEEEDTKIQQIQLKSEALEQQQKQRSLSPVLTLSSEVRQVHEEHVESSEPPSNNDALNDMLKAMRQEIHERDNPLKVQLQLRNEYMDAELKRRYQNLEEALRLRDE